MVTSTSAGEGAQRIQTVCGGGSSMDLSSTLVVRSVILSASSTMITRHGAVEGRSWALVISVRTSSIW